MKKVKEFNIGDKVFAKVKGYPAWPAIITEAHSTRYDVKFYGTGETGSVKPKDLFYYLKHKNTFVKSLKRKDYNDAIEQIENAIKECGTDGNNEEDSAADTMVSPNTSTNDSIDGSKPNKRKRSLSVSSEKLNDTQAKKKISSRSSTPADNATSSFQDSSTVEENDTPQKHQTDETSLKLSNANISTDDLSRKKVKAEIVTNDEKNEDATTKLQNNKSQRVADAVNKEPNKEGGRIAIKSEQSDDVPVLTTSDVKIITDDYLRALVTYADHVRKNEEIYRKKPVEERKHLKKEVVIAKLPEGKFVGIKYNQDPPALQNEYEQAEYDETEAKTILSLKTVVEQGSCKPEDDPHLFITNLNIDEVRLHEIIEMDLIERKRAKLRWLKIESHLTELDAKIKGCLALDKAEPQLALQYLCTMLQLEIHPLMLKKHPHVVDMIKRLRRYIGNVREWKMSHDEREQFEAAAEKIRAKAYEVYMKFAKLFNIEDDLFWEAFAEEVQEFKRQVEDMQECQVFALTSEPNSRQAFLDGIDEEEEMKIIVAKIEKTAKVIKPEKENSSRVANTDDNETVVLQ